MQYSIPHTPRAIYVPLKDTNVHICRTQRLHLFSQLALMTALRNGQALFIKKYSTRCKNVSKFLLFHIYMKLDMFRATHRPSSGAYNCTGSLWFFIRGGLLDVQLVDVFRQSITVPENVHQLHVQTTFHVCKTRGCQCSFRLLMMGGVSPETC